MTIRERRDQAATWVGTMIGRASVHLGMAHHVHRIATRVLNRYNARCNDCGRTLTQPDEHTSGLCLHCLNGPIPVTKPPASEVTQGRSRHGD